MITIGLGAVAFAANGVEVCVHDAQGAPVPSAFVVEDTERDWHAVAWADGCWRGTVLYLPDGSEVPLFRGATLKLRAVAPGYLPAVADAVVKHHGRVDLVLEPVPWSADPVPLERKVHRTFDVWDEVARTDPPEAFRVRNQAAELAEQWLAWADETGADRTVPEQVCVAVSSHPERCAR